jgi:amino acid transporter
MSAVGESTPPRTGSDPKLRRTLTVFAVLGVAVATGAPSEGVAINPQGAAGIVGRAIPLTLVIATVGVMFVWYGFIRLSQYFNHAGSAYALAGATLGPRAGVVAGWTLFGAYSAYAIINFIGSGIFASAFLNEISIHVSSVSGPWIVGLVLACVACVLAILPIRMVGRTLFVAEIATVILILILCVVILVRIIGGSPPNHQSFTLNMFTLPHGVSGSQLFLAVVFGFLYFAGFESAATLGEETQDPRKNIPRALLAVALLGAVFFIIVVSIELMGFGTGKSGISDLLGASSTVGTLGNTYVGHWLGTIVTFGITCSAFSCAIACIVGASRIFFALNRDAFGDRGFGKVDSRTGTPRAASVLVLCFGIFVGVVVRIAFTNVPLNLFSWVASIGTLGLLFVYLMVTVGTIRFLFFGAKRLAPIREIIIPLAGIAVVVYTMYRSIFPVPSGPAEYYPYIAGGWIVIAILAVLVNPGMARRIGSRLARDEGIVDVPADGAAAAAVTIGPGAAGSVAD